MRSQAEIQRVHDILVGVILGEAKLALDASSEKVINVAAAVLCWVLDHDHNADFPKFIAVLERRLEIHGYQLKEGKP